MSDAAQLYRDLTRAAARLHAAVDARLRAEHGLSAAQHRLLEVIHDVPGCRVYDIVREVDITVGAASKAVDRLEEARWVKRRANPDDRRSSLLSLTPAGARLLARATPTARSEVRAKLAGIAPAGELSRAGHVLAALCVALDG